MSHSNKKKSCPCGVEGKEDIFVACSDCHQHWHSRCCNLAGLDLNTIKRLEKWKCPICYVCKYVHSDPGSFSPIAFQSIKTVFSNEFLDKSKSKGEVFEDDSSKIPISSDTYNSKADRSKDPKNVFKPSFLPGNILNTLRSVSTSAPCSSKQTFLDDSHYMGTSIPCGPYVMYEQNIVNFELMKELGKFVNQEWANFKTVGEESREVLYYGIHSYRKSGHIFEPKAMPTAVTQLLDAIGPMCPQDNHANVNSCLITRYHSRRKVELHRDDNPVIDLASLILVVSLGATGTMTFISNDKSMRKDILLTEGSLLITTRFSQDFWKHGYFFGRGTDKEDIGYLFKFRNIAPYFMLSY